MRVGWGCPSAQSPPQLACRVDDTHHVPLAPAACPTLDPQGQPWLMDLFETMDGSRNRHSLWQSHVACRHLQHGLCNRQDFTFCF